MAMKARPSSFVDFVNGADVGMIQGRGGLGFTAKAAEGLRIFRDRIGQKLESNEATELEGFGLIDDPIPPLRSSQQRGSARWSARARRQPWAGTLEAVYGEVNKWRENLERIHSYGFTARADVRTSSAGSELSQDAALA